MIDALSDCLDMAVEHGASAAAAHLVPGTMDIQPFGGSLFAAADLVAHDRIENLRAAAGDGAEARFAQGLQRVADRHAKDPLRKLPHLDRGEGFDVDISVERAKTT